MGDNNDNDNEQEEYEDVEDIKEGIEEETSEGIKDTTIFSNPIEYLLKYHPECILEYEESEQSSLNIKSAPPDEDDKHHISMPFLSTFEYTKILGMRTNQLAQGARPYIKVPDYITDVQDIARIELNERRLPIIIKRYMPNGTYEKYKLSDLIIISS